MYFLSILIRNQRHHKIRLKPSLSHCLNSFVVEKNNTKVLLFSVGLNQHKLVFKGGVKHDTYFAISKIEYSDNQLIVNLIPNEFESIETIKGDDESLRIELKNNANETLDVWFDATALDVLEVVFKFNTDKKCFQDSIKFCFAAKKQIYDVAIDFGSEASQIIFHNRADGRVLERMKIVDVLTDSFYNHLIQEPLLQRDEKDNELIRSLFLLKKDKVKFQPHTKPNEFEESEFLNLLTSKNKKDDFKQGYFPISNMKLAHLGAYSFDVKFDSEENNFFKASQKGFNKTIEQLQQTVVNYFIHAILHYISKAHSKNESFYLVIKLLVPNVFEQERVSKIVSQTNEAFEIISNDATHSYRAKGAEISTISESDASFLGYIKQNKEKKLQKNGKYLIIDSGKGTTDFSIINLNDANKQEINSVFRSGFIGAGNVISYAFIETVFATLFGNNTSVRQKAIHDIFLRPETDIADKINFIEVIEQLKQNFSSPKNANNFQKLEQKISKRIENIRDSYATNPYATDILNQITDALKSIYSTDSQASIQDDFGFINSAVVELADRIEKEVNGSGFANLAPFEVILTGRAFLFQPFFNEIRKKYKNVVSVGTSEMKKICLEGTFSKRVINYDSNLVGKPQKRMVFTDNDGLEHIIIDNGGKNNTMILIDKRIPLSLLKEKYNAIVEKFEPFFRQFEGTDEDEQESHFSENQVVKEKSTLQFLDIGEIMYGYQNRDTDFLINGIVYNPANMLNDTQEMNVYFDGKRFLLRTDKAAVELRIQPEFFKYDQFVFETLFPYIEVEMSKVKVDDSIDESEIIR